MASIDFHSYQDTDMAETSRGTPWLTHVINRLKHWQACRRERQQLNAMSDHMLKDIGLTRVDVQRECSRSCWDTTGMDRH